MDPLRRQLADQCGTDCLPRHRPLPALSLQTSVEGFLLSARHAFQFLGKLPKVAAHLPLHCQALIAREGLPAHAPLLDLVHETAHVARSLLQLDHGTLRHLRRKQKPSPRRTCTEPKTNQKKQARVYPTHQILARGIERRGHRARRAFSMRGHCGHAVYLVFLHLLAARTHADRRFCELSFRGHRVRGHPTSSSDERGHPRSSADKLRTAPLPQSRRLHGCPCKRLRVATSRTIESSTHPSSPSKPASRRCGQSAASESMALAISWAWSAGCATKVDQPSCVLTVHLTSWPSSGTPGVSAAISAAAKRVGAVLSTSGIVEATILKHSRTFSQRSASARRWLTATRISSES